MLCLYSEITEREDKTINNFDLSIRNINLENILSVMDKEKVPEIDIGVFNVGRKKRFNTEAPYCFDTLFFMLITLFCYYFFCVHHSFIPALYLHFKSYKSKASGYFN